MTKLLNFLIRMIATAFIGGAVAWCGIIMSFLVWDKKFMDIALNFIEEIWRKN